MSHPRHWGIKEPNKPALVMAGSGAVIAYQALESTANRLAHLLRHHGLRRGDAVAVLMQNCLGFMVLFWAAQRAGLYFVPVSWRLKRDEIAYILQNSSAENTGAKVLVTSQLYAGIGRDAAQDAGANLILCGDDGKRTGAGDQNDDALAAMPATPIEDESLGRDMMYSSGTTGRPKGIKNALPDGAITTVMPVMAFMSKLYGFDEHTVLLCTSPMYHAAGLRYALVCGHAGGSVIMMERFDPETTLAVIERSRVTHVSLVPTMFVRLLKMPEAVRRRYDLSSLQVVMHGTGPCGREIKQAMIDWLGPILYENYGATEGNGLCAIGPEEWLARPGSVGKAMVGDLHVLNPAGKDCATGEDGLVYFANGPRFEYHGDTEKTAQAYSPEGWSTVGDIGHLDAEGYLYLTDRQSHMIISGGINIYPREVEDLLLAHRQVLDAAVFGVANEEYGEEVKAAIQLVNMDEAGEAMARTLIDYCRERIAAYKCPRSIVFCDDLPRHETGKIYKRLLKERFANTAAEA